MPRTQKETRAAAVDAARSDEGMALAQVMIVSAILFLLATLVLTLVVNQQFQSVRYQARSRAVHMADAGINAYLYQLRRDPNFWVNSDSLGPQQLEDGSWQVWATPPSGDKPLTLRSVGIVPSAHTSRTVEATVRFPTYADYMFVTDADLHIGANALIDGKIRANGDIENSGRVTGKASSAGSVSGWGRFDDGYLEYQPRVDFAQVTADLADIRTVAQSVGTYFEPSGARGYRVTISGTSVRIDRVTSVSGTGVLSTSYVRTLSIPAEGVFFFDDTIWVSGTYSAKVTVASNDDVLIPDHLRASTMNSKFTMGLIARNDILVPSWYADMPTRIEIDAALLAQNGSISADMHSGYTKNKATITGSMAYRTFSGFATYSGNSVVAGFRDREYNYDPRLDLDPPPMYPQIKDGSLKVNTWVEYGGNR